MLNQIDRALAKPHNGGKQRYEPTAAKAFAIEEMLRRLERVSEWLDAQVSPFARLAHRRIERRR